MDGRRRCVLLCSLALSGDPFQFLYSGRKRCYDSPAHGYIPDGLYCYIRIVLIGLCQNNRGGGTLVRRTFVGGLSDAVSAAVPAHAERASDGIEHVRRDCRHSEHSADMRDRVYSDEGNWEQHDSAKGFVYEGRLKVLLSWFGVHSLEVYLLHGVLLNILKVLPQIAFNTAWGIILTFANYVLTLGLCYMVIMLINLNRPLRRCLFFRQEG